MILASFFAALAQLGDVRFRSVLLQGLALTVGVFIAIYVAFVWLVGWLVGDSVTLPWIAPGVVAGALFAFAVSFDQFVVSYFLSEPGDSTLPVLIYTAIRKGFTPEINAISTLIITLSMTVMVLAARYSRLGGDR